MESTTGTKPQVNLEKMASRHSAIDPPPPFEELLAGEADAELLGIQFPPFSPLFPSSLPYPPLLFLSPRPPV